MADKDLVAALDPPLPENVRCIASLLPYRVFIAVALLAKRTV